MMRRKIAKEYLALVCGWPERDATTVDAPLLRPGERTPAALGLKQALHPEGWPAGPASRGEEGAVRQGADGEEGGPRAGATGTGGRPPDNLRRPWARFRSVAAVPHQYRGGR